MRTYNELTLEERVGNLAAVRIIPSVPLSGLNAALAQFVVWYNHVRPHQHLQGMTPMEAWSGLDARRHPVIRRVWDGLLQGEYLQR